MLAGVSDRAHRLGIAFEARPERSNEVAGAGRVDVIALLVRLLPTAGLVPEEVGDHQFSRGGDEVRQVWASPGRKLIRRVNSAAALPRLGVWESIHHVHRSLGHVEPAHGGEMALLEIKVHEVIELAHRALHRVERLIPRRGVGKHYNSRPRGSNRGTPATRPRSSASHADCR